MQVVMSYMYTLSILIDILMFIDCIHNRREYYWYLVILVPFGEWVYFFYFIWPRIIEDLKLSWPRARKKSIEKLERIHKLNPSIQSKVNLGLALLENKNITRAEHLFKEALQINPKDEESCYGYAMCRLAQGDARTAIEYLQKCLQSDRSFRDYKPWVQLAYAYHLAGETEKALEVFNELIKIQPRVDTFVSMAEFSLKVGNISEARKALHSAFETYEMLPPNIRRLYKNDMKLARNLIKKVG